LFRPPTIPPSGMPGRGRPGAAWAGLSASPCSPSRGEPVTERRPKPVSDTTRNEELEAVLRLIEEDRQQIEGRPFAVLTWHLRLEFCETKHQARRCLLKVPITRRAGVVHRDSGETWAKKSDYRAVIGALRKRGTAPKRFKLVGSINRFATDHKRGR
jgi:hypothetical protein